MSDVLRTVLQVTDALRAVGRQQLAHQVARVRLKVARELELALQDLLVDAWLGLGVRVRG